MKLPGNSSILKRLLIALPVVLALVAASLLIPAQQVSIEGIGTLSFETTITLSVGSEAAYASPDFLPGWSYRKWHVIGAAAGAGTNYQIRIRAYYGSGTDSGENVYLDGKCRTDFGDIRFTDDDGVSLLDYWMEESVSGSHAVFWVEVADDLSATDRTIYIYYGNAAATDAGDGDATFILFDDFPGPSLDGSKWYSSDANLTFSGSVLTIDNTRNWGGVYSNNEYSLPYNFVVRAQKPTDDGNGQVGLEGWYSPNENDTLNVFDVWGGVKSQIYYTSRHDGGSEWHGDGSWSLDTWYHYQIKGTPSEVRYHRDGTLQHTVTNTNYIPAGNDLMHVMFNSSSRYDVLLIDYCFLAKYVSPEPGHGAWGSEEPDIVNTPTSVDFGTVAEDSNYWSNDSTPGYTPDFTDGLGAEECYFTVTNKSSDAVDILIITTDFNAGSGWTVEDSPGDDIVTLKAYSEGAVDENDMVIINTTVNQDFIYDLAIDESKGWELKLETGKFYDLSPQTATITLTATLA